MFNSLLDTVFFKGLPKEDFDFIHSKFFERTYRKGQFVFFQDDIGTEMYIVKSGMLKICRELEDREVILGHQFPGEAIGELELIHYNNRRLASVVTMEKSTLWAITKNDLEDLLDYYPALLRKFFYVVSERLSQADRKIEYLAFLDSRLRVANLLLDLHSNFGIPTCEGSLINWKITQQHFAFMIGINRESAARALQNFQNEGIILIRDRQITVCNLQRLQEIATLSSYQANDDRQWHSMHKYEIKK